MSSNAWILPDRDRDRGLTDEQVEAIARALDASILAKERHDNVRLLTPAR